MWISFDLGVRGDYEGLYAWLDEHGAVECGDSVAYLNYESEGDSIQSLTRAIKKAIEVTKRTRIYAIWKDDEGKTKGRFIIGGRKAPPWSGYARGAAQASPDEG
jgi:hypothetical protein